MNCALEGARNDLARTLRCAADVEVTNGSEVEGFHSGVVAPKFHSDAGAPQFHFGVVDLKFHCGVIGPILTILVCVVEAEVLRGQGMQVVEAS